MTSKQKTILIVDDVKDIRESLALILEDEGHNTLQASNGIEAMQLIMTSEPIDMMITDVLMPEMDGIELSTQARKKIPELKMILISGGGRQISSGGKLDYLSLSAKLTNIDHVLKKPFHPEKLINLVDQLFNT